MRYLKMTTVVVAAGISVGSASADPSCLSGQLSCRYFLMSDGHPRNNFIFMLNDPKLIREAIAIIHMKHHRPHVSGTIDTFPARYNPKWGFHYEPSTISFPETSIEVCDAETSYVQEHLKEVGHHFLPGHRWCPWGQHVVSEIGAPSRKTASTYRWSRKNPL